MTALQTCTVFWPITCCRYCLGCFCCNFRLHFQSIKALDQVNIYICSCKNRTHISSLSLCSHVSARPTLTYHAPVSTHIRVSTSLCISYIVSRFALDQNENEYCKREFTPTKIMLKPVAMQKLIEFSVIYLCADRTGALVWPTQPALVATQPSKQQQQLQQRENLCQIQCKSH